MHRYDNTEQVHLAVLLASIAEERSKISGNFMPFGAECVPGDCWRIQLIMTLLEADLRLQELQETMAKEQEPPKRKHRFFGRG